MADYYQEALITLDNNPAPIVNYGVNFHAIVEYDDQPELIDDEPLIEENNEEEFSYLIKVNAAVSRICERVVMHWAIMKRIYLAEGKVLTEKLAYWNNLKAKDRLSLRGLSTVSVEEVIFSLDILKFFFDPERIGDKFMHDLATIFFAVKNSIKGIDLTEARGNSLYDSIEALQQFLEARRSDPDFRDNFVIYKDTWHKKCLEMAQFVALLNTNSHVLCLRPGSVPKTTHNEAANFEGRQINAEVGHGFIDFLGIDLKEELPEDPELREKEVNRRLSLAYHIRKDCKSYEIPDLIKVALKFIKTRPLSLYIWELKVLNDKPKDKEVNDYYTQISGYIEKLQIAIANNEGINLEDIEFLHGLVVIMPTKVSIKGDISGHIFEARLNEILRNMDSIATLYDRPHFASTEELPIRHSQFARQLSEPEMTWAAFQDDGITQIAHIPGIAEKITQYIERKYPGVECPKIRTIATGYYITDEGQCIEDPDGTTNEIIQKFRFETCLDIVRIENGFLYVRNNGTIIVNNGWSKKAVQEAMKLGFCIKVSSDTVIPPEHIGEDWILTFMFPRVDDSLVDLLANKINIKTQENSDCTDFDLLLNNIERNGAYNSGTLTLDKVAQLNERRDALLKEQKDRKAQERNSYQESSNVYQTYEQRPLEGLGITLNNYYYES